MKKRISEIKIREQEKQKFKNLVEQHLNNLLTKNNDKVKNLQTPKR